MVGALQDWIAGLGANTALAIQCALNALIGGALGLYVRELYRRFGPAYSNRESFGNLFPLLTSITVVIIFVVKSSLALSLGLVGALSIVRFRTAIKDPEELVYLFLSIAIGVALGAELLLLTILCILVITLFIVGRFLWARKPNRHNLLLTVSGDADRFFDHSDLDVVGMIESETRAMTLQRFDVEDGVVQFRVTVVLKDAQAARSLMSQLTAKLPDFQVSYVNLDNMV
ncbi:MAG: DUF4956 domain-containing protein [Vicinamibacteria bacterium]